MGNGEVFSLVLIWLLISDSSAWLNPDAMDRIGLPTGNKVIRSAKLTSSACSNTVCRQEMNFCSVVQIIDYECCIETQESR